MTTSWDHAIQPDALLSAPLPASPADNGESWWSPLMATWSSVGALMPWAAWAPTVHEADEPDLVGRSGMVAARHVGPHGSRAYAVFVPPEARTQALPVIMMLHGCKQNPEDFARGTAMNTWAAQQPCIVVYPQQTQRNNGMRCWNWFDPEHQRRDAGEPAVLAGILREVLATYGGDPQRVYVAGLSAGGAMAALMAQTYPDLIAAVAVHSGLPANVAHGLQDALALMRGGHERGVHHAMAQPATAIASRRTVPMLVLQGGADHTVAAVNARRLIGLHLPTAQAGRTESTQTARGRRVDKTLWRTTRGQVVGELWEVPEAGHAWFGGDPSGSYTDPDGPDASAEILRFFLAHPRPGR